MITFLSYSIGTSADTNSDLRPFDQGGQAVVSQSRGACPHSRGFAVQEALVRRSLRQIIRLGRSRSKGGRCLGQAYYEGHTERQDSILIGKRETRYVDTNDREYGHLNFSCLHFGNVLGDLVLRRDARKEVIAQSKKTIWLTVTHALFAITSRVTIFYKYLFSFNH